MSSELLLVAAMSRYLRLTENGPRSTIDYSSLAPTTSMEFPHSGRQSQGASICRPSSYPDACEQSRAVEKIHSGSTQVVGCSQAARRSERPSYRSRRRNLSVPVEKLLLRVRREPNENGGGNAPPP